MRISRKTVWAFAITALLAMLVGTGCMGQPVGGSTEGIAAVFDGGQVSESEVTDYTASFRHSNGYDDDTVWAEYLAEEGLTAQTWRERAIAALVDRQLMVAKAKELGVSVDEEQVERQTKADKEAVGAANDEEWARYLEAHGTNAEDYRQALENASLEQQVLLKEVALDAVKDEAELNRYISENLASRVARRYCVLGFDTQDAADAARASLSGLSGDVLSQAFSGLLNQDDSTWTTTENGGDIGWDIASDLGTMQNELNEEMLAAGELSARTHALREGFYVVLCRNRFEFHDGTTYADLPDDDLKTYVVQAANNRYWAQLSDDYANKLRENANVMVSAMPKDLPYDVEPKTSDARGLGSTGSSTSVGSGGSAANGSTKSRGGE